MPWQKPLLATPHPQPPRHLRGQPYLYLRVQERSPKSSDHAAEAPPTPDIEKASNEHPNPNTTPIPARPAHAAIEQNGSHASAAAAPAIEAHENAPRMALGSPSIPTAPDPASHPKLDQALQEALATLPDQAPTTSAICEHYFPRPSHPLKATKGKTGPYTRADTNDDIGVLGLVTPSEKALFISTLPEKGASQTRPEGGSSNRTRAIPSVVIASA